MLDVENLSVTFPGSRRGNPVHAVRNVSFSVEKGKTLGLVGESGCGKSTTARSLLLLNRPTSGRVFIDGEDIYAADRKSKRRIRRKIQMIFQDPSGSLNARMSIGDLVREPLIIHGVPSRDHAALVARLLDDVGLPKSASSRFPHELSGGQLQRASIARALAVDPEILVADEPVSALDVSVQVQIINLLLDLQMEKDLTYVFISHDLNVVAQVSDEVAVMYRGLIVEQGGVEEVFDGSAHPYTRALLSAVPVADPAVERERRRIVLQGDLQGGTIAMEKGCGFRERCWLSSELDSPQRCVVESPELESVGPTHRAACHYYERLPADRESGLFV